MKTYVEVIISTEGEKASVITDIFLKWVLRQHLANMTLSIIGKKK